MSGTLAVGAGMFTIYIHLKSNSWTSAIMPGIGTAFGLFLFGFVFAMSLRRESLVLDKAVHTATHSTWSLLASSRKDVVYQFDTIKAISVERSMRASGGGRGFSTRVTRARLLITKPRHAILLDETQGGGKKTVESVEELAWTVAEFLGVEARTMGKFDD